MPLKRVEKTGVYRAEDGHAVYLAEGTMVDELLLDNYAHDGAATKEYTAQPETQYFGGIQDAPQNQKAEDTWSGRMVSGAPENKAMKGASGNRSDADLADDADKGAKK